MPRISLNQAGGPSDDNVEAGLAQKNIPTQDTDDLLAEIDGLLENNAEEFVRSYVQKGGQ
ncbi:MAG: ubiquitin-like protein Pup [Corynebacterium sp.]|nr:ubiquitin-like protein Pup [Corynebacterium sp.]